MSKQANGFSRRRVLGMAAGFGGLAVAGRVGSRNEGVGRFEADVLVEEFEFTMPDGSKVILRNRATMTNRNEMRIITEEQDGSGTVRQIGVTIAKRVKTRRG